MAVTRAVGYAVDPPLLAAAPYGVINRVTLQPDDVRWEGGVGYESLMCAGKVEIIGACTRGPDGSDDPVVLWDGTGKSRAVHAEPFGITATDTCTSSFGSDFREKAEGRVFGLLDIVVSKVVESELRRGFVASNAVDGSGNPMPGRRWLEGPDTVILDDSGDASPLKALSMLEGAFAACSPGGGGVVHITPEMAIGLLGIPQDVEGVMYAPSGSMVIVGAGYKGLPSDTGQWAGDWMWMTGAVQVWLGEPRVYPETAAMAFDRKKNDIRYKAERLAAVTYDGCCTFAVKVDNATTTRFV